METNYPLNEEKQAEIFSAVEAAVQHVFKNRSLLREALTHSSYANETLIPGNNERLEFLGDAVIGLFMANCLMDTFPQATEGKLSRWRSNLVSRSTLAQLAEAMELGKWILLGRGERQTGGAQKVSILAGCFEALIGALYLDGSLEPTFRFLKRIFAPLIDKIEQTGISTYHAFDRKTFLQERTQAVYRTIPVYRVLESWGFEHDKYFKVGIEINGKLVAEAQGKSKKEAEQAAAGVALEILGLDHEFV